MVKPPQNVIFWKVGYQNFFQEICFSGGKKAIHKVSAAFIVKNCLPRTSLKAMKATNEHISNLTATVAATNNQLLRLPNLILPNIRENLH